MERKKDPRIIAFADNLRVDYPDAKVFLFGSRSGKDFLEDSDYDVIVVSGLFDNVNFFKRTEKMYKYWAKNIALDVFCYTPEEFEEKKKKIGFLQEALKNSVPA
ncbi:MAG: nucleotidyltransferase domain-containing protein [archaeon]|nr:nucleotidyltransferase domain-containing protein [archaeon]